MIYLQKKHYGLLIDLIIRFIFQGNKSLFVY